MPLEPAKPSPAADALPCWQVRWDSGRKSGAVSMNEGPSWRRNIWQSCLLKQTRDDHKLVLEVYSEIQDVGQSNLAREDVGKGEGGRNTNRKGGEAQCDQQALSSGRKAAQCNIPEAFMRINYNSTPLLPLLAVRPRCSSMRGSLEKAEGKSVIHLLLLKEVGIWACAILLPDHNRSCYRSVSSTRMWRVACLGNGLYFAHLSPGEGQCIHKLKIMKQKSCNPLAAVLSGAVPEDLLKNWLFSDGDCSHSQTPGCKPPT